MENITENVRKLMEKNQSIINKIKLKYGKWLIIH